MTVLITRKDYEALPEGLPMELCDGMLLKQPSPRYGHQRIQSLILERLKTLLPAERVIAGPIDVLVDELNVFVPDIVVLDEVPDDDAAYVGIPAVVFEILSPSTAERDRTYKVRRYLGLGVREVWLIDRHVDRCGIDGRGGSIEVIDLDGLRCSTAARRTPPPATPSPAATSRVIEGFDLAPGMLFGRG